MVVAGMPWGVDQQQRPVGQHHGHRVGTGQRPRCRNRLQLTVGALHFGFAVERHCALIERARVEHMAQPARMHQQPGLGQGLHQQTGTACMVEVDMGRDDPIDR